MVFARYAGFGVETTPGTPVAATFYLPVRRETIVPTHGFVPEPTITARGIKTMTKGLWRNAGDLVLDVHPEKFTTLLKWAFGTVATTGVSAPYTHKFSVSDDPPLAFTTRIGVDIMERVIACSQVNTLELAMSVRDVLLAATARLVGGEETKTTIADPLPTFPTLAPFSFGDTVTASIGGTAGKAAIIEALTVRLNNNVPERYTHEGRFEKRRAVGEVVVDGDLDILFPDATEYDRFLAGASFAAIWKIVRGAYPTLQVDLPKIVYNAAVPHIANRAELKVSAGYRAMYGTVDSIVTPLLITILNSEATV